jgi:MoaA/NifB/PqqE/SkfB family radical SAM enzyme
MIMLNIVCTSKPGDGLLFYSYEYCSHLNEVGIEAQVCVITHRNFTSYDYTDAIADKYIHCKNIKFDTIPVSADDITLIMGNSMLTLARMNWRDYNLFQQTTLKKLFGNKLISVYSENHPKEYPKALSFFDPMEVVNLCDTDVYPNGDGEHFEKIIHFPIYKEVIDDIQFDHLFLGTNKKYYETVQKVIGEYPNHGILTYHTPSERYLDFDNNNLRCPVPNLLGKFKTYVYTKDTFDPAPRLFQEARYFGKDIIYQRSDTVLDGGYWYWKRGIKEQDLSAITTAIDYFTSGFSVNKVALIDKINNKEVWFCSIPWVMAFTNELGEYSQCNFGQPSEKTIQDTSIQEWMTGPIMENIRMEMVDSNSKFEYVNKYCSKCINDEKNIGRSRRHIANEMYSPESTPINYRAITNAATRSMRGEPYKFAALGRILEIQVKSFGIECNLDCHMCHHFSSSIRTKMAFDEGVWNEVVWGDKDVKESKSAAAMAKKPVDKVNQQILDLAPYIYNLKIIGGEPLIMKKHYELLDKLIEIDQAKHIQIKYQTNGTVLASGKHNVLKYIPQFNSVIVCVSLDGVGKYNDYIRRRSNYKTIKENMKTFDKYPNVQVDLNSTVTFFSVLHLYKIAEEFKYEHNCWPIDRPSQMKANNLPQEIKDKLIPRYEKIPYMKEIADLLKLPPEPDFNAKELYKYCLDMDKSYEGTKWEMNLFDVFPELKEHYELI